MAWHTGLFTALLVLDLCGLSLSLAISDALALVQSRSFLPQGPGDPDDPFARYEELKAATNEPFPRVEELEDSLDVEITQDLAGPAAELLGEADITPSMLGVVDGAPPGGNGSRAMRGGRLLSWPGSAEYPLPTENSTAICTHDDRVLFFHYKRKLVLDKRNESLFNFKRCYWRHWHGVGTGGLDVENYNTCLATRTGVSVPCSQCLGAITNYAFYYYHTRPQCRRDCKKLQNQTAANLGIHGKISMCGKACQTCLDHLGPYVTTCLGSQYWWNFVCTDPSGPSPLANFPPKPWWSRGPTINITGGIR